MLIALLSKGVFFLKWRVKYRGMEKSKKEVLIEYLILTLASLLIGFLMILFGATSISPLFGGIQFGHNEFDGNFFLYLGSGYINGLKPYIDLFDHKGLYIFWIEALGALMGGQVGMYVIMSIYMSVNIFCYVLIFKELGFSRSLSYFYSLLIGIILLFFSAMGGHHSGELLNPFFSLMILFYIRGFERKNRKYMYLGSFIAGLAAGLAFSSRPSEMSLPLAAVIFYFIYWLKYEKNLELLWNALLAIGGFMLPVGASLIEASVRGFLPEMFKCVFGQSSVYVKNHDDIDRLIVRLLTIGITIGSFLIVFFRRKKISQDEFFFFSCLILIDGAFQVIIARFTNYWISFLPIVIIAIVDSFLPKEANKTFKIVGFSIESAAYLGAALLFVLSAYIPQTPWKFINDDLHTTVYMNDECKANLDKIEEEDPNHEKEVYILDTNIAPLLYMNRFSSCKYIANSTWWSNDNPSINEEVLTFIKEEKPYWIITAASGFLENDLHDYVKNNYQEIMKDNTFMYLELK